REKYQISKPFPHDVAIPVLPSTTFQERTNLTTSGILGIPD
ncbi:hypothetical protein Tco_1112022, partial [Tanacetum coccineum]